MCAAYKDIILVLEGQSMWIEGILLLFYYYYYIEAVLLLLMVYSCIFSLCASQWDAQTEPKITTYFHILASLLSSKCLLFDCS